MLDEYEQPSPVTLKDIAPFPDPPEVLSVIPRPPLAITERLEFSITSAACGCITVIDLLTLIAAAVIKSPICEAVMMQVPAARTWIAPVTTEQTPDVDVEKLTGKEGPALLVATNT